MECRTHKNGRFLDPHELNCPKAFGFTQGLSGFLGFRVWGLGAKGFLGFRVWGLGVLRFWGLGVLRA